MAEVLKLGRFRKAKAKAEATQKAEDNRVRHGRTKAEKLAERHEKRRQDQALAGKRLVTVPAPNAADEPAKPSNPQPED